MEFASKYSEEQAGGSPRDDFSLYLRNLDWIAESGLDVRKWGSAATYFHTRSVSKNTRDNFDRGRNGAKGAFNMYQNNFRANGGQ